MGERGNIVNWQQGEFFHIFIFFISQCYILTKKYIENMVALNNLASYTEKEEHMIVPINFKDVMV